MVLRDALAWPECFDVTENLPWQVQSFRTVTSMGSWISSTTTSELAKKQVELARVATVEKFLLLLTIDALFCPGVTEEKKKKKKDRKNRNNADEDGTAMQQLSFDPGSTYQAGNLGSAYGSSGGIGSNPFSGQGASETTAINQQGVGSAPPR